MPGASNIRPVDGRRLPTNLTARRAAFLIGGSSLLIAMVCGLLMRVVDKKNFPNTGSGLWWAVQTVTTVGYGDRVPTTTAGQILATLVMVVAIGLISVLTAAISAVFIESARQRLRRGDQITLEEIAERLERIERRLEER
jgi:voltage-gated potassium channel